MLFSYMDQIDSSIIYLDRAKAIMIEINAPQKDMDYVDYARAEGYYHIKEYDKALELFSSFEKNNFSSLEKSVRLNSMLVLSDLYAKKNNYGKSIKILNQVEKEVGSDDYQRELEQVHSFSCLLYTSPSPRDRQKSRMPSSA